MTLRVLLAGAVAALVVASPAPAQDAEEIVSYDVAVDVRPGGSMLVTELITVRALGREIRRGIYRDFPTSFPKWSGLRRIEAPFEVRRVLRAGSPEPFSVTSIGGPFGRGGMRVRIGDADVMLEPGMYSYTIEYETDRWVHFGASEDRLHWNATGHGWGFPIRSATATVRVAELAAVPELRAWTGPEGSTASDADMGWDGTAREARFATTRPLAVAEGMSVELRFAAGHLTPPSEEQRASWFGLDWGGYVEAGYVVLLVIAVYLIMWRRVGVDPAEGPTVPRQGPPPGFSPAALGYLEERGYEMSHLAAALVSMAMKGAIRIERDDDTWTLYNLDDTVTLSPEERAVFDELLGSHGRITLSRSQHGVLRGAIKALKRKLARQLEHEYFVNNRVWFAVGLAISVAGFAALAWRWRFGIQPVALFVGVWLTIWTGGVATLGVRTAEAFRVARRTGGPVAWGGFVFTALFGLPFYGAEILVAFLLIRMVPSHLVLAAIAIGATNVAFYHWLERPTLRGRGVLDHLDGFRAYLAGDGERRLRVAGAGAEVFERYLPHAIALGLEQRWAAGFGETLSPAAIVPDAADTTPWYHHHGGDSSPSSFASSLGSSLASTLSTSSSPPSSGGSGGGSGGFSGGGGGGGGGGGW